MKKPITIVIADDHPLFRAGVRQALEREKEFTVLAEAGDGARALELINEHRPDAVVLDINMPRLSGLNLAKELAARNAGPAVILLTMFDDEEMLNESMDLGVKAYLLKESASLDVAAAVRSAIEGRHYISPTLAEKLLHRKKKQDDLSSKHPGIESLSPSERKVLKLISESKTSKEIADAMFLSPKTIENYRFKISEKLDVHGSYSLLKFALEHKSLL